MGTKPKPRSKAALRRLALVCIVCSGGCRDARGAYTLCALCDLAGAEVPPEATPWSKSPVGEQVA
ncbi:hypothetical protein Achl_3956 (plasmid) [Pseudarthrobacter chlorophenolicus A6]|uniref:Uncharacterized protein n=1 Tax=Pseudarthrobacter chlorophenolicus (strain ATCC 700700 / DSM 12829 / CIP 107037 / JCM 12360 / KCTC 9906 / NCIMB 13794 / A6) TaxID=452863 RepID=B8HHL0_PSECP|nr:hypothetical protein [Pseudarthrobacter chlorophenolicus]ACL41907.1 hypothetical protein Achl_3956 [Pseudarthrobacter chlorophenolicus A6]